MESPHFEVSNAKGSLSNGAEEKLTFTFDAGKVDGETGCWYAKAEIEVTCGGVKKTCRVTLSAVI